MADESFNRECWICFAQVGAPHGIRGAFFCDGRGDESFSYSSVCVEHATKTFVSKVKRVYKSAGRPVLELESVTDRSQAEALRGAKLLVRRAELSLEEDEYLAGDLVGSAVTDESGALRGRVLAVHDFGAQPTLEIGLDDGSSTFFPFLEAFILRHDVANRVLQVREIDAFSSAPKAKDTL